MEKIGEGRMGERISRARFASFGSNAIYLLHPRCNPLFFALETEAPSFNLQPERIIMHSFHHILRAGFFAAILTLAAPVAQAANVLVDFGSPVQGAINGQFWNGTTDPVAGSIPNAVNSDTNIGTGITISITGRFNAANTNGTTTSTVFPTDATRDSFYGNAGDPFGTPAIVVPTSTVEFTNLDLTQTYNFTFYASRTGVGDNRDTRYTLTGAAPSSFVELAVANNVNNTAVLSGIVPDALGKITLVVSPGTANTGIPLPATPTTPNNPNRFFYLGALQLTSVPEPSTVALLLGALPFLARRRRC